MKIEHFEDIEAWQLARELTRLRGRSHCGVAKARKVYHLTKKPGFEKVLPFMDSSTTSRNTKCP